MGHEKREDTVEVVYATLQAQRIVTLALREGLTAGEAVRLSGLLEEFPEINERPLVLGVYGERIEPDRVLRGGDRVEVLRPLERDPRELRRELLRHGLVMGAAPKKPER